MAPRLGPLLGTTIALMTTWLGAASAQLTAPLNVVAEERGVVDLTITASFSSPVTALVADMSFLPPSSGATFTPGPDNVSGAFHWSPEVGMAGTYFVTFEATVNGQTYTMQTTLHVHAEGTTAYARSEFVWFAPSADGTYYTSSFAATDQGGTTTLGVPVNTIWAAVCPDSRGTIGVAQSPQSPQRRAGFQQALTASGPTMSWSGNPEGALYCVFYSYWEVPIDLYVEAVATTPESNLTLNCTSDLTCYGLGLTQCGFFPDLYARDPLVTAPATAHGAITAPITIHVVASDPDGDPIKSLAADLSDLPLGNDAVFTDSPDHAHGTLTWTPALADSGDYNVEFRATNSMTAAKTTAIHVRGFDITAVPADAAGSPPAFSAVVRPNPLGSNSMLQLVTTRPGPVRVRLFDAQGRLVREVFAQGNVGPGDHQLPLGAVGGLKRQLRSGVYFYRVEAAEGVLTGRLAVLR